MNIEIKNKVNRLLSTKQLSTINKSYSFVKEIIYFVKNFEGNIDNRNWINNIKVMHEHGLKCGVNAIKLYNYGASRLTLENYILRYGEEIGKERYTAKNVKVGKAGTKEAMVAKHGQEKADDIMHSKGKGWRNSDVQAANSKRLATAKINNPEKYKGILETQLEYWKKKGYSDTDAEARLKDRQRTFTLDKCVNEYGYDVGFKMWQDRQDRWQDTLNTKSAAEIALINASKGTDRNGVPHAGTFHSSKVFKQYPDRATVPGIVYYIKFYSDDIVFWKIGITVVGIDSRFGSASLMKNKMKLNREENILYTGPIIECFDIEQMILKINSLHRINIDYNGFKSTECFSIDIIKDCHIDEVLHERSQDII